MKMTVVMEVTVPQALTLKAMFEYWNTICKLGGSHYVSFYVDGDGDFHPQVAVNVDGALPELTSKLRDKAVAVDMGGSRRYDPDGVAWALEEISICDGCGSLESPAHHIHNCTRPGFTKVQRGEQ